MATPSWLQKAADLDIDVPAAYDSLFPEAKKVSTGDASGSIRAGVIRAQERTVSALHGNGDDSIVLGLPQLLILALSMLWDLIISLDLEVLLPAASSKKTAIGPHCFSGSGGTSPSCILEERPAVETY